MQYKLTHLSVLSADVMEVDILKKLLSGSSPPPTLINFEEQDL